MNEPQTTLPDAIFFDWDGTLVSSISQLFEAHNSVRDYLGEPRWNFDEYMIHIYHSSRELYPRLYKDRADEAIHYLYKFLDKNHLNGLTKMEEAAEMLETLHQAGTPMAVVSNKRHDFLLREVSHFGWNHYFKSVIGAGEAEKDKPDAAPVRMAMQAGGLNPDIHRIWFVGDTKTDMEAAKQSSCEAVLILNGEDKSEIIDIYAPVQIFNDCKDMHHMISTASTKIEMKAC